MNSYDEKEELSQGIGLQHRCDTCERFGEDLPVRIGIGLKGDVEECPKNLTQDYPQLPSFLVYTLRILETGYLYIYGENWSFDHFGQGKDYPLRAYSVSNNGALTAIPLDSVEEHEDVEKTHLECFESQKGVKSKGYSNTTAKALVLDVYSGAENFGIIYSRHQFSKEIIEKSASKDKSIFLNVSKASSEHKRRLSKSQINLIDDLKSTDFEKTHAWIKDRDITNKNNFIRNRKNTLDSLIEYFENDTENRKRFPIIVLDDPVGILKDIGQIMRYLKEKYNDDNDKNLFMDAKFSEIQFGVQTACEAGAYFEIEDYTKRGISANYKKGLRPDEMIYGLQGNKFKINTDKFTTKELNEMFKDESFDLLDILTEDSKKLFISSIAEKRDEDFKKQWGKYLKVVDNNKYDSWVLSNSYQKLSYNIDILSNLYIKFYESDMLFNYMNKYFDKENIELYGEYFNILNIIIGDSAVYPKISEFFYNQLKSKSIADRNYCLRSLCYNNEKLKNHIESNKENLKIDNTFDFLINAGTNIPQNSGVYFGYSQVVDEYDAIILRSLKNSPSHAVMSEKLHAQLALIFNEAGSDLKNYPVAFGTQVFNEQKFIRLSWTGPASKMTSEVITTLQNSGFTGNKNQDSRISGLQSKLDRIRVEMNLKNPSQIIKFEAILNKELYYSSRGSKVAKRASNSVFDYKFYKDFMNSQISSFQPKNNRALALGVFGSALQCISIAKAYNALFESNGSLESHIHAQAQAFAQPLILIGSIMDYVQRQLQTRSSIPNVNKNVFGVIGQSRFDTVRNLARFGLYGGATVFAALEFKNAWVSFNRNNLFSSGLDATYALSLIGSTYLLRKGTGYMSARILGLGSTGWGILLILVGFGIDYYADYNRRQQLRVWLKESAWGTSNAGLSLDNLEKNYILAVEEVSGTDYKW